MTTEYKSRIDENYVKHMVDIKEQVGALKKDQEDRDRRFLQSAIEDGQSVVNKSVINMEDVKKANRNFTSLMADFRNLMLTSEQTKINL